MDTLARLNKLKEKILTKNASTNRDKLEEQVDALIKQENRNSQGNYSFHQGIEDEIQEIEEKLASTNEHPAWNNYERHWLEQYAIANPKRERNANANTNSNSNSEPSAKRSMKGGATRNRKQKKRKTMRSKNRK